MSFFSSEKTSVDLFVCTRNLHFLPHTLLWWALRTNLFYVENSLYILMGWIISNIFSWASMSCLCLINTNIILHVNHFSCLHLNQFVINRFNSLCKETHHITHLPSDWIVINTDINYNASCIEVNYIFLPWDFQCLECYSNSVIYMWNLFQK